jgi:hypothetical protein
MVYINRNIKVRERERERESFIGYRKEKYIDFSFLPWYEIRMNYNTP